jgi:hypothetical protein
MLRFSPSAPICFPWLTQTLQSHDLDSEEFTQLPSPEDGVPESAGCKPREPLDEIDLRCVQTVRRLFERVVDHDETVGLLFTTTLASLNLNFSRPSTIATSLTSCTGG